MSKSREPPNELRASGLFVGGIGGILRSPTPGLFAIASGLQCAALGTAYYGGRKNVIPGIIMFSLFGFVGQHIYNALDVRQDSTIALKDARSRDINSVTTSRSDQIPSASTNPNKSLDQPIWRRVINSKWSPMKVLSDEEYERMLRQKLLRVDAEIAILDDDIAKARAKSDTDNRS
ncbi:hypothetical protein Q9189_003749 [Teloschistes chrysophthalmus]